MEIKKPRILLLVILVGIVAIVSALPQLPASFWGTLKINGNPAPIGTVISAWINNISYPDNSTVYASDGSYKILSVYADDPDTSEIEGGKNGDIIIFKVNINGTTFVADQVGIWNSGVNQKLGLNVSNVTITTTTTTSTTTTSITTTTTLKISNNSDIVISAIQFDAPGDDRKEENLNGEWVEISNNGNSDIDLTGWRLNDNEYNVYNFLSNFKIKSGHSVKIHTGSGTDTESDLYWNSSKPIWNNDGDTATLKDKNGDLVDSSTTSSTTTPISPILSITRVLPSTAQPNSNLTVSLQLLILNESSKPNSVIIKEYVPKGWNLISSNPNNDDFNSESGEIRWFLYGSEFYARNLTYSIIVLGNATGNVSFSGVILYTAGDNHITLNISGINTIQIGYVADQDNDGEISDFELLDYINLWIQGAVDDFSLLEVVDEWAKG